MAKRNKNRRIKKTKYLSLSLQFPGEKALKSIDHNHIPIPATTYHHQHQQHLDLLEKDGHDDNMEYLLSISDGELATTLTGLLDSSASVPVYSSDGGADEQLSPSASVSYAVSDQAMNLVRTALRSRERDSSTEERYVRYSEVVNDDQRRRDHEEVSSRVGGDDCNHDVYPTTGLKRLSLKLDYEKIISAWSDKGGFYVHSDSPQTVPDINHHLFSHPITNGGGGGLWSVPDGNGWAEPKLKIEEEEVGVPHHEHEGRHRAEEEWKAGQREASVLRYREKKRNRLFTKTIRYQVRKENAQKRPRVKGRFVKRS